MEEELLYQIIGRKIRAARLQTGMSQAELAERLQMTRTSVVNIEYGRQRPPLHVLWQIADAMNVEPVDLVPRREEYLPETEAVKLDPEEEAIIENVVNGDDSTRQSILSFVKRAKTQMRGTS